MPRPGQSDPAEDRPVPLAASVEEPSFWRRGAVRRIGYGLIALALVSAFGVVGYVAQGWDLLDSLYMVAITVSTVGFTEVRPLATPALRLHTMVTIGLGSLTVAYLIGSCVQFFSEGELYRLLGRTSLRRRLVTLNEHAIVVGFGRMGSLICDELAASGSPFVVIEHDPELIAEIQRRDYLFVRGDATEEETLVKAGVERARALVTAVATDADSLFITLTARQMAPRLRIIARAELPSSQRKLIQAGADHVVLTAAIGAKRISALIRHPHTVEFVELVTNRAHLDLEIEEVPVRAGEALDGSSLRNADIGRRTGVMVIAIKRSQGRVEFPPTGDEQLEPGDALVLLGRRPNLDQFRSAFCPSPADPAG